jgi:hypothetical protein
MQGIYTYISETNHVPKQYNVAAILSLLFMVPISLAPALVLMYFYISTFRSMCAVLNMAVFCSSLILCFPGMVLTYFLNVIIIIIIIIASLKCTHTNTDVLLEVLIQWAPYNVTLILCEPSSKDYLNSKTSKAQLTVADNFRIITSQKHTLTLKYCIESMYSFIQNYYFFSTNTNTTSVAANQSNLHHVIPYSRKETL